MSYYNICYHNVVAAQPLVKFLLLNERGKSHKNKPTPHDESDNPVEALSRETQPGRGSVAMALTRRLSCVSGLALFHMIIRISFISL